jgi:outer membrane protein
VSRRQFQAIITSAALVACAGPAVAESLPRYGLRECIELALRQNAEVQAARKRLQEAAGALIEARAGYLPALTASANFEFLESDYARLSGVLTNREDHLWNVHVRLTQNLYSGGAVQARLSMARLGRALRMRQYQATVDRVVMEVRLAFYEILRNQAQLAVHQQAIEFLQRQLANERARLELGTGQRLHLLRAEVNLALEQSALVGAENRLRNSYLRLSELLAVPYSVEQQQVPFEIEGELPPPQPAPDLSDCLARAFAARPELDIRQYEIEIERRQLTLDRSALLPRVELFAGYDVVSEPDRARPLDFYDGYVAGVLVRLNLFDGLATHGRMRATRARIDAAELAREATRRSIEAEVVRAFGELQRAEEVIRTQTANVELARESLQLASRNFQLGLSTQLELLQAQLDLSRAQTAELSARYDYNAALARLERAIGSRFEMVEPPPPATATP